MMRYSDNELVALLDQTESERRVGRVTLQKRGGKPFAHSRMICPITENLACCSWE